MLLLTRDRRRRVARISKLWVDVRFGFSNITCKYKNTAGWSGTRYIYGAQGYRECFQFMMSDSSQEDTTEKNHSNTGVTYRAITHIFGRRMIHMLWKVRDLLGTTN